MNDGSIILYTNPFTKWFFEIGIYQFLPIVCGILVAVILLVYLSTKAERWALKNNYSIIRSKKYRWIFRFCVLISLSSGISVTYFLMMINT